MSHLSILNAQQSHHSTTHESTPSRSEIDLLCSFPRDSNVREGTCDVCIIPEAADSDHTRPLPDTGESPTAWSTTLMLLHVASFDSFYYLQVPVHTNDDHLITSLYAHTPHVTLHPGCQLIMPYVMLL